MKTGDEYYFSLYIPAFKISFIGHIIAAIYECGNSA